MKSDDERKKKLDHAIKKKQDKKDIGIQSQAADEKSIHSANFSDHSFHSRRQTLRDNLSRGSEGGLKSPVVKIIACNDCSFAFI